MTKCFIYIYKICAGSVFKKKEMPISTIIHYVIWDIFVVGYSLYPIFKEKNNNNNLLKVILRIIFIFFTWILVCYLADGCPLTHLENFISLYFKGYEIYPNYHWEDCEAYEKLKKIIGE